MDQSYLPLPAGLVANVTSSGPQRPADPSQSSTSNNSRPSPDRESASFSSPSHPSQSQSHSSPASGPGSSSSASQSKPIDPAKIVKECFHKLSQIILQARIPSNSSYILPHPSHSQSLSSSQSSSQPISPSNAAASKSSINPTAASSSQQLNRWFNLSLPDVPTYRHLVDSQMRSSGMETAINIDLFITINNSNGNGGGSNHSQKYLLERWTIHHAQANSFPLTATLSMSTGDQATMYKRMILLIRTLYSFVRLLPTTIITRYLQQQNPSHSSTTTTSLTLPLSLPFTLDYSIRPTSQTVNNLPFDISPTHFDFSPIPTNKGKLLVSVLYRPDIDIPSIPSIDPFFTVASVNPLSNPSSHGSATDSLLSSPSHSPKLLGKVTESISELESSAISTAIPALTPVIIQDYIGSGSQESKDNSVNQNPSVASNTGRTSIFHQSEIPRQSLSQAKGGLSLGLEEQKRKEKERNPSSPEREPQLSRQGSTSSKGQSQSPDGGQAPYSGVSVPVPSPLKDRDRQISDALQQSNSSSPSSGDSRFPLNSNPSSLSQSPVPEVPVFSSYSRPLQIPGKSPATSLPASNAIPIRPSYSHSHSQSQSNSHSLSHSRSNSQSNSYSPSSISQSPFTEPPTFGFTPPQFSQSHEMRGNPLYDEDPSSNSASNSQNLTNRTRSVSMPVEIPQFSLTQGPSGHRGSKIARKPLPGHFDPAKASIPTASSSRVSISSHSYSNSTHSPVLSGMAGPAGVGAVVPSISSGITIREREPTLFGRNSSSFTHSSGDSGEENASNTTSKYGNPPQSRPISIPIQPRNNGSNPNSASNSLLGRTPPFAASFGSQNSAANSFKFQPSSFTGSPPVLSWMNANPQTGTGTTVSSKDLAGDSSGVRGLKTIPAPQIGPHHGFQPSAAMFNHSPSSQSQTPPSPLYTPVFTGQNNAISSPSAPGTPPLFGLAGPGVNVSQYSPNNLPQSAAQGSFVSPQQRPSIVAQHAIFPGLDDDADADFALPPTGEAALGQFLSAIQAQSAEPLDCAVDQGELKKLAESAYQNAFATDLIKKPVQKVALGELFNELDRLLIESPLAGSQASQAAAHKRAPSGPIAEEHVSGSGSGVGSRTQSPSLGPAPVRQSPSLTGLSLGPAAPRQSLIQVGSQGISIIPKS